jgi:hypothetical protein
MKEVKFTLTADASQFKGQIATLEAEVKDLTSAISELEKEAKGATNPKDAERYTMRIKELKQTQVEVTDELKKTKVESAEFGKASALAGNQISQAFKAMGIDVDKYGQALSTVRGGTQGATGATNTLGMAMKALPIVAIVGAFVALWKAFTSTQEGADRVARVMVPLKAILSAIWGVVQGLALSISDGLGKAFRDPLGALAEFGAKIKTTIVNQLVGLLELIPAIGSAIVLVFKGKWSEAGEVASNAVLKIVTGVENLGTKIKEGADELSDLAKRAIEVGNEIQAIEERIRKARIAQAVPLANLRREFQELSTAARDMSKSEEERSANAMKAIGISRQVRDMQAEIIDMEIRQLELKQSLNNTNDAELLQLEELKAKRQDLFASTESETRRLQTLLSGMSQAQLDELEKQAQAETELDAKRREMLLQRAENYRQLTLTEDQIRDEQYAAHLVKLEELRANEIISEAQFLDVKSALYSQFYGKLIEAKNMEAKAAIKAEKDKNKQITASHAQMVGDTIAGDIARGRNAKEIATNTLRYALAEIVINVFKGAIAKIPFPFNLVAAPVFAATAYSAAKAAVPAFQSGGLVGGGEKLIRVNEAGTEFVTNANTTRAALPLLSAMNANPALASAMNNQFTGQVSLNDNGLTDRMGSMVDKMGDVVFRFENGQFIGGFRELQRIDNERIARTE